MENKENTNLDSQQASKLLMSSYLTFLRNISNKNQEEVEDKLKQIIEIFRNLSEKDLFFNEETSESEKYFINEFAPDLLKILLNENTKNPTVRDLIQELIKIYVVEFNKAISKVNSENSEFKNIWEKIENVFNEDNLFYRPVIDNKDASDFYFDYIYEKINPDYTNWRNGLKVGDFVDYLLKESSSTTGMYKGLGICNWTRAEILNIDQNRIAQIRLIGTDDIHSVSLTSFLILPFKTLSLDFEWREALEKGDEIDYLDNKSWYRSTALEVNEIVSLKSILEKKKENENPPNKKKTIKYGLRIYRDKARNTDTKGKSFYGWGETYDKEVSVHDPKLRKPNTFSKIIHTYEIINYYPLDSKKFTELETIFPHELEKKKFYIIPKKYENKNISFFFYILVEFFCVELNGLENILSLLINIKETDISNKSNQLDQYFPIFSVIMSFFNHINQYLHYSFAKRYLKKVLDLSFAILKKFSLIETRNFKRDKFENLFKQLKDIMFRVYIESDVNAILDYFGTEFGINCLKNSAILDKKLLGFKVLCDTLNEVTKNIGNSSGFSDRHIPASYLVEKIISENVFDIIFGPSSHSQILHKSADFIKSLLMSKSISDADFKKLFDICDESTDPETKNYIYKGIISNSINLSVEAAYYIIRYIITKKNSDKKTNITNNDIDLLISSFRSLPLNAVKEIARQVGEFLFKIIFFEEENPDCKNNNGSGLKFEKLIEDFLVLMKSIEFRDASYQVFEDILKVLKFNKMPNNEQVCKKDFIEILNILRLLMGSYLNILDDSIRSKILIMIYDEYEFLDLIMEFCVNYHKEAKQIWDEENTKNTEKNTDKIDKKINSQIFKVHRNKNLTHSEVVNGIINFITFMMQSQKMVNLTKDQIHTLYNIFVENPISQNDVNLFFKMLKEADTKKAIPQDIFLFIFENMVNSKNLEFTDISFDLFNCVWNIFLIINKSNLNPSDNKPESYSSVGPAGQTLYSYSYNNKSNESEIKCSVDPSVLIGFDLIWKMVLSASSTAVVKEAIGNIIKIYFNCSFGENKGHSWGSLVEKCITTIKNLSSDEENFNKNKVTEGEITDTIKLHKANQDYENKILNCLNILKSLIEETEKKGTAGCVSHNSILKSAAITLKIENNVKSKVNNWTSSKDSEKKSDEKEKFFNLKVYTNTTIWDLKKLIANKINTLPEGIRINTATTKDITENDHGKILSELNIKDGEKLIILPSTAFNNIPRQALTRNGQFTEKANKVFNEIFDIFKDENGVMNQESAARFATIATDSTEPLQVDDQRVKYLFETYDFDKDGFVNLEGFKKFFHDALEVSKKIETVWDNIRAFGYRNDLKKTNEPLDEYNTNLSIMPRYLISKNQEYFDVIFCLQDECEKIAKEASKFLSIICTNPVIYKDILLLKDLNYESISQENHKEYYENLDNSIWLKYIDVTNKFKLLYILQIIESFFEEFEFRSDDIDSEPFEVAILEESVNSDLFPNHKIWWIEQFLSKGGLKLIIQKLYLNININEVISTHYLWKKILNLSTKIIKNSFSFLFRAYNLNKEEVVQFIRKESFGVVEDLKKIASMEDFPSVPKNNKEENEKTNVKTLSRRLSRDIENLKNDEELIKLINEKYGDGIINTINFEQIALKLIIFSYVISQKKETEVEERNLFINSVNLLSLIIISQDNIKHFLNSLFSISQDLTEYFKSNEKLFVSKNGEISKILTFDSFFLCGILRNSNLIVKINFQKCLSNLCTSLDKMKEYSLNVYFVNLIKNLIFNMTNEEKSASKYLFVLFANLLELNTKLTEEEEEKLSFSIIELIFENSSNIPEELLNGYLKILILIIKKRNEISFKISEKMDLPNKLIDTFILKDVEKFKSQIDHISSIEENQNGYYQSNQIGEFLNEKNSTSYIPETKNNIFNLILIIFKNNFENMRKLFEGKFSNMSNFLSDLKKDRKYYNPSMEKRKSGSFVGLKNLHSICYMNSVIQQFFNVPTFRYSLIQVNDEKMPNFTEENKEVDDNILHQMQRMFVFLENSLRGEFNPKPFCYSFKDFDGHPTNVNIQNDAQEFLGRLFDKLEFSLKNTDFKYLLNSIFMGKTCSQLICKGGCGKIRNNFEDFYSLSLEVQGKKSLKDSLEKYISEERIDEYFCDDCNKKVNVIKRNSFAELPNVMIIHLQRIIFNYDTFTNEKINSRLEFPKKLNMKDFSTEVINNVEQQNNFNFENTEKFSDFQNTNENDLNNSENLHPKFQEDLNINLESKNSQKQESSNHFSDRVFHKDSNYYEYELVGVVVHLGTANAGHYYSYINIQRDGVNNKMNFNPEDESNLRKWMTFNDSSVSNFNIDQLEKECFGGSGTKEDEDHGWGKKSEWDNSKNAYMLVYERIKKTPINLIIPKEKVELENYISFIEEKKKNELIVNFKEENKFKIWKNFQKIFSGCNVSLDCDDTVISRRDVNLSDLSNYLFYNEDKEEYFYFSDFYKFTNKENRVVPQVHIKEVLVDNLLFLNDINIFCTEFAQFFDSAAQNVIDIFCADENSVNNSTIYTDIIKIFIELSFNFLSKMSNKDSLPKIVLTLAKFMEIIPEFSKICLEYLVKNKEQINELILSLEENSNISYKNLIVSALVNYAKFYKNEILHFKSSKTIIENSTLNSNFGEFENFSSQITINTDIKPQENTEIPLIYSFLDILIELLPVEISKIWHKMLAYLELFEALSTSNNEIILDYLYEKELIFRLVDLFLGKDSPFYEKGQSRSEMGNKISPPKFTPLLNTVSNLTRRCFTNTWNEKTYQLNNNRPNTFIEIPENPEKIFHMSNRDIEALNQGNFFKKCIKENYNNTAVSKLLAHLMFDNLELSKKRVFLLLQTVNEGISLQDAKNSCELIFNVLNLNDKYHIVRLEWLFGKPQLNIRVLDVSFPHLPKNRERIYKYPSSLAYGTNYESFIERVIYKYKASMDYITILNYFFSIIFKNPITFLYFDSLPHPEEQGNSMKEYIFSLANEELNRIFTITHSESKFENSIKGMTNIMASYGEKKKEMLSAIGSEDMCEDGKFLFQPNYKIGEILFETIQHFEFETINKNNIFAFIIDYENNLVDDNFEKKGDISEKNENGNANLNEYLENEETYATKNSESSPENQTSSKMENVENSSEPGRYTNILNPETDKNIADLPLNSGDQIFDMSKMEEYKINKNENVINLCDDEVTDEKNVLPYQNINKESEKSQQKEKNKDNDFEANGDYNEEIFYSKNLSSLIERQTSRYDKYSDEKKDFKVESCIKRILIYNDSEMEYKVRFSFFNNDNFENFYLPKSDIVVIAKKKNVTNVQTFIKIDANLPWNHYDVVIECESYERSNEDTRQKDANTFGRSKSMTKQTMDSGLGITTGDGIEAPIIYHLPEAGGESKSEYGPKNTNSNNANEDLLPIECQKCFATTYFGGNNSAYICSGCKQDLFS